MYDIEGLVREPLLLEPLRRSVATGEPPAYLRSLKIKVTARCNLKCVMCRYGRGWAPPEMGTEPLVRTLSDARELGCRKVHFSGGEVLARRDFEQLVAHAAELDMKVTFTSNLTLLTKDRARALLKHRLSSVSTSLDGATPKMHDRIRGVPGSFKRTVRSLELIQRYRRRNRPRLRINFVMMRDNFRDYPKLVALAGRLGAVDVVPMPVDTKQAELRLSKRLIHEYNEQIAPEVRQQRQAFGMSLASERLYPFGTSKQELDQSDSGLYASGFYQKHLCFAPYLHAFIAWDGKVYLCCMTNGRIEPLGDVSRQSLREVFLGKPFQEIRRQMKQARLASCHHCDMLVSENRLLHDALKPTLETQAERHVHLPLVTSGH